MSENTPTSICRFPDCECNMNVSYPECCDAFWEDREKERSLQMKRVITTDENEIAALGNSAGYEWAEFRVWYKDGFYYVYGDAGCSCYSFEVDDTDVERLTTITEVLQEARRFADDHSSYIDAGEYTQFAEEFMRHRK